MVSEVLQTELEEDTQRGKYLTFLLGAEDYGIEIAYVTEIIGVQTITSVPQLPAYIQGIINLRGRIIPVMDMRLRFQRPFREYNDRTCVIIIDILQTSIGLIVDSVSEVAAIPDDAIVPPPDFNTHLDNSRFIKAIGKIDNSVKLLLDCEKLLTADDAIHFNNLESPSN